MFAFVALLTFCVFQAGFIIWLLVGSSQSKKETLELSKTLESKEISLEEVAKMFENQWFLEMVDFYNKGQVSPGIPVSDGNVEVYFECENQSECLAFPDRCEEGWYKYIDGKRYCKGVVNLTKLVCGEEAAKEQAEKAKKSDLLTQSEIDLLADALVKSLGDRLK